MEKGIVDIVSRYKGDDIALNRLVVTAFVLGKGLDVSGGLLADYVEDSVNDDILALKRECSFEDVISIFELAVSKENKTVLGAVYTPGYIREYIVRDVISRCVKPLPTCLCADISCGCGAFLYTLLEVIHARTCMSYRSIIKNLFGVDIDPVSVTRAKILLALVALSHGEVVHESDFNMLSADSLTYDFKTLSLVSENGGFDIIVGNPPYVSSKYIGSETKANLRRWETARVGKADLYIPFLEIGLSNLNDDGLLGYITMNSFFKSVNARAMREYLYRRRTGLRIVDFGQQRVFDGVQAYTCLVFASKASSDYVQYVKADIVEMREMRILVYSGIPYSSLDNHCGWNLCSSDVFENIRRIEGTGEALGKRYVIKNGIATLANDVFIFKPMRSDETYYYFLRDGMAYRIEKGICRDIVKSNVLRSESDIQRFMEKVIMPYDDGCKVLSEQLLKERFPCAYSYLCSCRDILDRRDKGKGGYGAWYAFGRNQALADKGKKLLFPCIADKPYFVYSAQEDLMFYSGYAIYCDSEEELLFLKRVLESDVMDYYIRYTSKPFSSGFFAYTKNYVRNFGLYPFSEEEKRRIMDFGSKDEVNRFVCACYRVG